MYRKKTLQCKKALGIVSRLIQNIHRDFNILHKETCSFQLSKWSQASLFYLQQSVCFYGRHQGFSSDTSESLMVTDLLSTLSEFDWLYQSIKFCNLSLLFWPDLVQEKTYYMYYNFVHTNKQSVKKGQSNILNKVKKITSRLYTRINSLRLMHHAVKSKKSIFHWWFLIPHTINTSFFRF